MATPLTASQLLAAFDLWKVKYREHDGWRTHNRNSQGAWGPVHGVVLHHVGDDARDDADFRVLWNGRSDLPGPLCQWGMRDDGTVDLIGNGRCNHAGKGAKNVLDAVKLGKPPPKPGPDTIDGNAVYYGQETYYSGTHAPTNAAYLATVKAFAAVCHAHGWNANHCIGHKEHTARKPDPGNVSMAKFRGDVQALLDAGPPPKPKPPAPPEEDMALSSDDIKKIAQAVWEIDNIPHTTTDSAVTPEDPANPNWRPLSTLSMLDRTQRRIEAKLDQLLAALADDGR